MVRLKADLIDIPGFPTSSFNSIVVRLKEGYAKPVGAFETSFNSIVVRLKGVFRYGIACANIGFNSIVVRLKAMYLSDGRLNKIVFQFHSGSIKSKPSDHTPEDSYVVSIP